MAEKARSPKYPVVGLGSAIEKLKSLYEREKTASVDTDVAVKAWGYIGLSGPALQTISTLTQFGLIERTGKQKIKISELGLDILIPKTPDDKLRAIQTAAFQPSIFRELMNEYPNDLPSDDTLKNTLVRRNNAYTEDAAKKTIKSFKETREIMKQPEMEDFKKKDEEANKRGVENLLNAMGLQQPPSPHSPSFTPPPKPKEGDYHLSIPLKGRVATLIIPNGEPTLKDLESIKAFMDFCKKILNPDENIDDKKATK